MTVRKAVVRKNGRFAELPAGDLLDIGSNRLNSSFGIVIDGQGAVISTGIAGGITIPFAGTITGWEIVESSSTPISGSIVVDIWKDVYANYPPSVADTIISTKPTLSSAIKNQNLAPTFVGAGASVAAGDQIIFNVDSCTASQKVRVTVFISKT